MYNHSSHIFTSFLLFFFLLCFIQRTTGLPLSLSDAQTESRFHPISTLGSSSISNIVAKRSHYVHATATLFVSGVTQPFSTSSSSPADEFGTPLHSALRGTDIFLARLDLSSSSTFSSPSSSAFRLGSADDDELHGMVVATDGNHTYLSGCSRGSFLARHEHSGQLDAFVVKLDTSDATSTPVIVWSRVLGTSYSDCATQLHVLSPRSLLAVGYTGGTLFPSTTSSSTNDNDNEQRKMEAFAVTLDADTGDLDSGVQFGNERDDTSPVDVTRVNDSSLVVTAHTQRRYGNIHISNVELFALSLPSLAVVASVLLKSYSREVVAAVRSHNGLPDAVLVAGFSYLDARHGFDMFVKRVDVPSPSLLGTELGFDHSGTARYGSENGRDEVVHSAIVLGHHNNNNNEEDGGLIMAGHTNGGFFFKDNSSLVEESENDGATTTLVPFVVCVHPVEKRIVGAELFVRSNGNEERHAELAAIARVNDSVLVYVLNVLDHTSGQFHIATGAFQVPRHWADVRVRDLPTSSAQSEPKAEDVNEPKKSSVGVGVIGGVGAAAALALVVAIVCVCKGVRRNKLQTGTGTKGTHKQKEKEKEKEQEATGKQKRMIDADQQTEGAKSELA